MKRLFASSALAVAFAVAPAYAQPPTTPDTIQSNVTVQGAAPSTVTTTTGVAPAEAPRPQTSVTIDTAVTNTPSARVETTTEVITPVSGRPALDVGHPIAPEVQAVVDGKKNYTTADIVKAQHEAMLATPVSQPTTVITTTKTTPKSDG